MIKLKETRKGREEKERKNKNKKRETRKKDDNVNHVCGIPEPVSPTITVI